MDPAPEPTQTLAVLTGCAVCVSGPCRKMDLMVTQRQLGAKREAIARKEMWKSMENKNR